MAIFDMFGWVVRILTWLPGAIQWAENHYGPGSGDEKRENVLEWIDAKIPSFAWSGAAEFGQGLAEVVSGIVKMFHATGVFKHRQ